MSRRDVASELGNPGEGVVDGDEATVVTEAFAHSLGALVRLGDASVGLVGPGAVNSLDEDSRTLTAA